MGGATAVFSEVKRIRQAHHSDLLEFHMAQARSTFLATFLDLLTASTALIGLAASHASAARFVIEASNTGSITGAGRDLTFDLTPVTGEIKAAQLLLALDYSNARELSFRLVNNGGAVNLPISPTGSVLSSGKSMVGRYLVSDNAVTTWGLTSDGLNTVPNYVPVVAYQNGLGGPCKNLLGRYLEFDVDRLLPVTLEIGRIAAVVPGSGAINAAQLIIDTEQTEDFLRTGMEEPATALVPCKPPALNVVLNGQNESMTRSNFVVINYSGANEPANWYVRDFVNPDIGPLALGTGRDMPYVGRFGGRSRLNLGFWQASTGSVNFTTGSGARTIFVPGDWANTPHRVMPGDYDGDGVTDAALAFFANSRWNARILYSRSGNLRDYLIDPRFLLFSPPIAFTSNIGFGAGEDANRDGVDEINIYAEGSDGGMRRIELYIAGESVLNGFVNNWGRTNDVNVRGKWTPSTGPGNQFSLMVARQTATNYEWYLFGNNTPVVWGLPTDDPVSINLDGDEVNEYAVYRRSDLKLYYIESTTGAQRSLDPLGGHGSGFNVPLGRIQGVTAPLQQ